MPKIVVNANNAQAMVVSHASERDASLMTLTQKPINVPSDDAITKTAQNDRRVESGKAAMMAVSAAVMPSEQNKLSILLFLQFLLIGSGFELEQHLQFVTLTGLHHIGGNARLVERPNHEIDG